MSRAIDELARRVQDDPFFLAAALLAYTQSEGMDDTALAARLGCPVEALSPLRLCRRPHAEPPRFRDDVARIAARFGLDADCLSEVLRRADALDAMRRGDAPARGTLLAARDRERGDDGAETSP